MSVDLQELINMRQKEISDRLFQLHQKQEELFMKRLKLKERKVKLLLQLEELKLKGFLK